MPSTANQKKKPNLCRACLAQIPLQAAKCEHCGSYQRFLSSQKFIDAGDLALGVVSLLVSFLAATIAFSGQFVGKNANIQFDVVNSRDGNVSLLIQNDGKSPAAITDGWVSTFVGNGPLFSSALEIQTPFLIKPAEYSILSLKGFAGVPAVGKSLIEKPADKYRCRIGIHYKQLGKMEEFKSNEFICTPQQDVKRLLDEQATAAHKDIPREHQ